MDWQLPPVTLESFGEGELADLDDRAIHILRMRSGMWDGERRSLREVSEEFDLGVERIRQLETQALTVIRRVRETQRHLRDEPVNVPYRWRLPKTLLMKRRSKRRI